MNPHTALGIAQIVFYLPIVPLAIWLMRRNGGIHPRMAWWPFIPFSLMRLAGGPLVIALHKDPTNIALAIVAIIFLNVGVVPLVVAASGFIRIVIIDNFKGSNHAVIARKFLRLANIAAIALLAAGGALGGQPEQAEKSIGRGLSLAGYSLFTVELVAITVMAAYYSRSRVLLLPSSRKVILALLVASPFLIVRTTYGFLQIEHQHDLYSRWNPLYGSTSLFAAMALLMEYVALVVFMSIGFWIPPGRGVKPEVNDG